MHSTQNVTSKREVMDDSELREAVFNLVEDMSRSGSLNASTGSTSEFPHRWIGLAEIGGELVMDGMPIPWEAAVIMEDDQGLKSTRLFEFLEDAEHAFMLEEEIDSVLEDERFDTVDDLDIDYLMHQSAVSWGFEDFCPDNPSII